MLLDPTASISPKQIFGEPQSFRLPREGDRDLIFDGWLIGEAEGHGSDTVVRIFLTVGKQRSWSGEKFEHKYLTDVFERWSSTNESDHRVGVHEEAEMALEWLKRDNKKGTLGAVSKAAWTAACQSWPPMAAEEVERVD